VSLTDVSHSDCVLIHEPNTRDEFVEIRVIGVREDTKEQSRTQSIQIEEELPGFVSTGELFCDVTRRTVKGTWKVMEGVCDSFAMSLPRFPLQDDPSPTGLIIRPGTVDSPTPEADHQVT
jgi:hypothetical protein